MSGNQEMVRLDGAGVSYASGTIGLHSTTIGFSSGEFTVLLGRSGAGKSTLLRSLNGLAPTTAGRVVATGLGDLRDRRVLRAHRRRTAMIFQQHQLIGRYTALQNVLVGRIGFHSALRTCFPAARRERLFAFECLDRVELLDRALDRVDSLSGGQQQRVGIARALAQEPRLVLADEPVASLDPATSERVLRLLHSICRHDGIPAIVSLHQLELAVAFADRIVGLADGRVVFDGPPSALSPDHLKRIYGATGMGRGSANEGRPNPKTHLKLEAVG